MGISVDKLEAQKRFSDKERLTYPLLADAEKKTAKAYGVLSERGLSNRVTFIIDKDGVVRKIYRKVNPPENAGEVLDWIKTNLKDK